MWVDFKAVKEAVSMEMALRHYGLSARKVNSSHLKSDCPLPTHSSKTSKQSFNVDTDMNVWSCQSDSCVKPTPGKKGGNVLDFVAVMEDCTVRDAAVKLSEWFGNELPEAKPQAVASLVDSSSKSLTNGEKPRETEAPEQNDTSSNSLTNKPLGWELRGIDYSHPYLASRGISRETAEQFGVGFFPEKGSMAGRVVFPLHNEKGELVAPRPMLAARSTTQSPAGNSQTAFTRARCSIYNLHRVTGDTIIVCESFWGCLALRKAGISNAVALMGRTIDQGAGRTAGQAVPARRSSSGWRCARPNCNRRTPEALRQPALRPLRQPLESQSRLASNSSQPLPAHHNKWCPRRSMTCRANSSISKLPRISRVWIRFGPTDGLQMFQILFELLHRPRARFTFQS